MFALAGLRVAIVLDAVSSSHPSTVPDTAPLLALLRTELTDALSGAHSESELASRACAVLDTVSHTLAPDVGVALSLAIVSSSHVIAINLGTVGCAVLQTNHRRCVELSHTHDAFDADEVARLPPSVQVVKHGPHVRLVDAFCPFTRCLGLAERAFVSHVPHV